MGHSSPFHNNSSKDRNVSSNNVSESQQTVQIVHYAESSNNSSSSESSSGNLVKSGVSSEYAVKSVGRENNSVRNVSYSPDVFNSGCASQSSLRVGSSKGSKEYQRQMEIHGADRIREAARLRRQRNYARKKAGNCESSSNGSDKSRHLSTDSHNNNGSCTENFGNSSQKNIGFCRDVFEGGFLSPYSGKFAYSPQVSVDNHGNSPQMSITKEYFSQNSYLGELFSQDPASGKASPTFLPNTLESIYVTPNALSGSNVSQSCSQLGSVGSAAALPSGNVVSNMVVPALPAYQLPNYVSPQAGTSKVLGVFPSDVNSPKRLPNTLESIYVTPNALSGSNVSQLCSQLGSVGSAAALPLGNVVSNMVVPALPAYQLPNYVSPQAGTSKVLGMYSSDINSASCLPNVLEPISVSRRIFAGGSVSTLVSVAAPVAGIAVTPFCPVPPANQPTVGRKGKRMNRIIENSEDVPLRKSIRVQRMTPIKYVNPKIATRKRKGKLAFKLFAASCPPLYNGRNSTINSDCIVNEGKFYAAADSNSLIYLDRHNLGNFFEEKCKYCRAYFFPGEINSSGVYSNCCLQGKIHIDRRKKYPAELWNLISLDSKERQKCPLVKNFREYIRNYNNMFAFASFGFQRKDVPGIGPYVFKIHGAVHHSIGSLHPEGSDRKYAQLYMIDSDVANRQRLGLPANENTLETIVEKVDSLLRKVNPFAKALMMMREVEKKAEEEAKRTGKAPVELQMYIASEGDLNPEQYKQKKLYSLPAANEVAMIFSSEDGAPPQFNHIAVHSKSSPPHHISPSDPRIDALTYPLLYPYGELGWRKDIPYVKTSGKKGRPKGRVRLQSATLGVPTSVNSSAVGEVMDGSDEENMPENEGRLGNGPLENYDLGEVVAGVGGEIVREQCDEEDSGVKHRKFVTSFEFYKFEIHTRPFDALYWLAKLKCQFFVGTYARIEADRLHWLKNNQDTLRVELYKNVHDFLARSAHEENVKVGQAFILPSTFIGSPRSMQQNYLDAMAIVTETSKPDYFITMTCNPKWKEILSACKGQLEPWEVPDVICRVFHKKVMYLLDMLGKDGVFGNVEGYTGTIEFQKRGLPHLHLLLIMKEGHKPKTAQDVDRFVSAMLPDPKVDPLLYEIVTNCMVHSPCISTNHACQSEGKCTKKFPKPFVAETVVREDGYPEYRRAENIGECESKTKNGKSIAIDNSWVVPYNPFLLKIFECHINVEICTSINAVKYIYKYIYKGMDRVCLHVHAVTKDGVTVRVMDYDEIKKWIDGRYLSAIEAAWRLFGFPLQFKSHAVERLPMHLEDTQRVIFVPGKEQEALEKCEETLTKLTAFFKLCQEDESARDLLYKDVPKFYYFTRVKDTTTTPDGQIVTKKTGEGKIIWVNKWVKRKGMNKKPCIGRITFTGNGAQELSCLRVLLLHKRGPTGYEDLKTVDGVVCETFYEAAVKLGLVETDEHFRTVMSEAVTFQMPSALRQLFVDMAIFNRISDARVIYEAFKNDLSEDFVRNHGMERDRANVKALVEMQSMLMGEGKSLADIGLEMPPEEELYRDCSVSVSFSFIREVQATCQKLNPQQNLAVQVILLAVERFEFRRSGKKIDFSNFIHISPEVRSRYRSNLIYLDGPAGSGKTFVYNTVIGILKCMGLTYLCVAPTGLAASLLEGGRTIHSKFNIGIKATNESNANISGQDKTAKEIRNSSLLVWDEISMCGGHLLDIVSRCYQDLHSSISVPQNCTTKPPFQFAAVVCGGDFRQQPPVTKNVGRNGCRALSVKGSHIWDRFQRIRLETNMRAAESDASFSDWLVSVGDGVEGDTVGIDDCHLVKAIDNQDVSIGNPDALIDEVFGEDISRMNSTDLAGRAILCPKNVDAEDINNRILGRLQGSEKISYSSDVARNEATDEVIGYPEEFLNTLQISGLPPHELKLKNGCVIMLLRNMSPSAGLCNGTRLIVRGMTQNNLYCEILTGSHIGEPRIIPKLRLTPTDIDYNFIFTRYQFPVKLSYSMTIHKSQGQSFNHVGIYLKSEVFTHGQLYTALSRVKNKNNLKIDPCDNFEMVDGRVRIKNVVYPQMLN